MKRLAALAAFKLSLFFKGRADTAFFQRYSRLISETVTEEELTCYFEDPLLLFADRPVEAARYQVLYDCCQGDSIALTAIQLYLLAQMEERTLSLLREGFGVEEGLTIETAGRIACRGLESIDQVPALRRAFDRVELILQAAPAPEFLKAPFRLDGRLAAYLSGDDQPDRALSCRIAEGPLPPPCLTGALIDRTVSLLPRDQFSVVQISGEASSGRRFFAQQVAHALGRSLLLIPFDTVHEDGRLNLPAWRRVLRELALSDRLLCLWNLRRDSKAPAGSFPNLLRQLERDLAPFRRPVLLTTGSEVKTLPFLSCFVDQVRIPTPTILQEKTLWETFAQQHLTAPEQFPAGELASKMTLTAGQIERIVTLLSHQQPAGPWKRSDLFRLCYQVLDDGRYENIRFVDTAFTWEELKLEPRLKEELQAVCAQVEYQGIVLDGWGLRRKFPYGRSVSVLFSGPPGTGKTMAAQVLSSALGLELYKVDLSQMVDKYIGETEKRLKQVFDQAEKSNLILFFDEADALLGKRSEVKDAKDKYANTEVAYLLQRMEEYSGIVLMATNQAGNMDTAFLRRFRYHLVFTLPDEDLRRDLWTDLLSDIPSRGISYDYLAKQFEISGAQIKNIVLNAAYQAAADGGELHMDHLIRAVFQEQQKEGKVMLASEFGAYGVMLSELLDRRQER
ncbi:MAG: ATP-binding protein [Oscillospiraceae bacterium]|nr:ATP-binding protein [Oscillospiraceae bacterium]